MTKEKNIYVFKITFLNKKKCFCNGITQFTQKIYKKKTKKLAHPDTHTPEVYIFLLPNIYELMTSPSTGVSSCCPSLTRLPQVRGQGDTGDCGNFGIRRPR